MPDSDLKQKEQKDSIQFLAKYGDWVAVKKITCDENTEPLDIIRFFASVSDSFDRKTSESIAKLVDTSKIDAEINEMIPEDKGRFTSEEIAKALSSAQGPKVGKVINELTFGLEMEKKDINTLKEVCKTYAVRRALEKTKVRIDYNKLEVLVKKSGRYGSRKKK
ncbi:MAG: DUF2666 family protein [Candidatus Diapherotrites archaeon]|nr:DUF2666 family protein [Candidatus Diapherotrites archaeon]